jgi:hypothetical protein
MKTIIKIVLIYLVVTNIYFSQGVLKVTTDKSSYSYGDSIEVRVTLTNNTNAPFTIYGSSSCVAMIKFNDVKFQTACTADQHEFSFSVGMSMTWIWKLDPKILGIPDQEGQQKIVGLCYPLRDSIFINAPKYRGGIVAVGIRDSISESVYKSLRDSINATVIERWGSPLVVEYWKITNHSLDSLVEKYSKDYRLKWIEAKRPLQFSQQIVTAIDNHRELPLEYSLSQNYPNPFNPLTKIKYKLPKSSYVKMVIYDNLGGTIKVLVNEFQNAGSYELNLDATNLSSGVYYYRIQADEYSATKKLVLLK